MPKKLSTVTQFWERICAVVFWVAMLVREGKWPFFALNWSLEWASLTLRSPM